MPPVHADDGTLVNAVVGFLNFLARLIVDRKPGRLVVAMEFGSDWRPQFRVALIPEYKSHRVATDDSPPEEVEPQLIMIAEVMRAIGVAIATPIARITSAIMISCGSTSSGGLSSVATRWLLYSGISATRNCGRQSLPNSIATTSRPGLRSTMSRAMKLRNPTTAFTSVPSSAWTGGIA